MISQVRLGRGVALSVGVLLLAMSGATAARAMTPATAGAVTGTTAARAVTGAATATGTSAATGPLPFDLPAKARLRASAKKVFAHYFTPYPVSLDNKESSVDYYTKNYLNPAGESGKHAAYGGLLRDRPRPRAVRSGDYQLQDMESEVKTAAAAGIDGFTVDMLSLSSANWTRLKLLVKAAETVDTGFTIVPMPDMTSLSADAATLAASLAELAASKSIYRLADGRVVVSPFKAEAKTAAWWADLIDIMNTKYGIKVALVPTFLNFSANAAAFAPISYGFSNWGNRSPAGQSGIASNIKKAHDLGKIWMQPVSVQDERPNQSIYDEALNTQNLRTTWEGSISNGADWVQLTTWNDFSEGTQFTPSPHNDSSYLDISSYYLTWLKTGAAPAIVRDTVYLTHRTQLAAAKPTGGQTKLMAPRSGTSTPRDSVEILSFLTGAATVNATIGGTAKTYQGKAGVQAQLYPLANGTNKVSVVRSGATTATVTSPWTVVAAPVVQDLQYHAVSSGR
ncbi:glycoside hydrolase family 71 protein [Nonomuraea sp. NPDC049028]|uniref:glycoside hydrolase family 71 protein n=1 Tax=Nonomuraea sp. NPDC049028 TaxID=3364348 RepID=UPI00371C2E75